MKLDILAIGVHPDDGAGGLDDDHARRRVSRPAGAQDGLRGDGGRCLCCFRRRGRRYDIISTLSAMRCHVNLAGYAGS